jgi:NADPH:quinone reductase-like Zn-dependent oxidoreductase
LIPIDWKFLRLAPANAGNICGCDYAGIVEEVGSEVTHIKRGDEITGFMKGATHKDRGAFGGKPFDLFPEYYHPSFSQNTSYKNLL